MVDYSHRDRSLNTLLRISESRRRLLGLDISTRQQAESEDLDAAIEDEFAAWLSGVEADARSVSGAQSSHAPAREG